MDIFIKKGHFDMQIIEKIKEFIYNWKRKRLLKKLAKNDPFIY